MQFSRKDRRILKKLTDKLPMTPGLGWESERIAGELGKDRGAVLRLRYFGFLQRIGRGWFALESPALLSEE